MASIAGNRKALITGGASGFGFGVAQRLVEHGAQVALADVDEKLLLTAVSSLGEKALAVPMDVRDSTAVRDGVRATIEAFGGLDTLVNSAGVCRYRRFEEIPEEEWDWIIDVNLKGTFLVCQASLPYLRSSGRGRIVNVSSNAGKRGVPLLAPYVCSKFGVIGLTQSLAVEFARDGVTANAVLPANTPSTRMGQELLGQKIEMGWGSSAEEITSRTARLAFPLGRVGTVSDTADAILFLISENASFITGHSLLIDGGSLLAGPSIASTRPAEPQES